MCNREKWLQPWKALGGVKSGCLGSSASEGPSEEGPIACEGRGGGGDGERPPQQELVRIVTWFYCFYSIYSFYCFALTLTVVCWRGRGRNRSRTRVSPLPLPPSLPPSLPGSTLIWCWGSRGWFLRTLNIKWNAVGGWGRWVIGRFTPQKPKVAIDVWIFSLRNAKTNSLVLNLV